MYVTFNFKKNASFSHYIPGKDVKSASLGRTEVDMTSLRCCLPSRVVKGYNDILTKSISARVRSIWMISLLSH